MTVTPEITPLTALPPKTFGDQRMKVTFLPVSYTHLTLPTTPYV